MSMWSAMLAIRRLLPTGSVPRVVAWLRSGRIDARLLPRLDAARWLCLEQRSARKQYREHQEERRREADRLKNALEE